MEHLPLVGGNAWTTLVGAAVVRWLGGVEKRDEPPPVAAASVAVAEEVGAVSPALGLEASPTGQ